MYEIQRRTGRVQWESLSTFHGESDAWTFVIDKLKAMRRRRATIFQEGHERVKMIDQALKECEDIRAGIAAPALIDAMGVQFRVIVTRYA